MTLALFQSPSLPLSLSLSLSLSHIHTHTLTQVLSKSVADALAYFGDPETEQTEKFLRLFDKFFV